MQLMTKEIEQKLPKIRSTGNSDPSDIDVVVKFFAPWSNWTWYATEGEKMEDGDWIFYGLVEGLETELGCWLLSDLQNITGPLGLKIERDKGFTGKLSALLQYYVHGR